MSTFEIVVAIIFSVVFLIIISVPLFMYISGTVKEKMDKEYGNTGIFGWVIAILIAGYYVLPFTRHMKVQIPLLSIDTQTTYSI